jgi:hypothetical protein
MNKVHIHAPAHHFIGQVRQLGCRTWKTVGIKHSNAQGALADAVLSMNVNDKRARALMITESGYYDPVAVMEASRS